MSVSGENLDSAAKLMADALSKASAELEKTVNVLTEQLSNFNQSLEKSFKSELQASHERMEAVLRQNIDALSRDKESVLKTLAEYKQAEIEKVILGGKTVRGGLAAQVEDSTRALSQTVASRIAEIREQLQQPENDLKAKYDQLGQALQLAVVESRKQVQSSHEAEAESLNIATKDFNARFSKELGDSQRQMELRFNQKRTDVQTLGEQVVGELAQNYDRVVARIEAGNQELRGKLGENRQEAIDKLKQLAASSTEFVNAQEQSFLSGLNDLSGLLNGLYETRLNNLAAQSRTEILSAAQNAEDCLLATRTELQACLKEYQRDYAMKYEGLHSKLEKSLDELTKRKDPSNMRGLKEERAREQLRNLFRRIGNEMVENAAANARRLESEFQRSMDVFEERIKLAKSQACESLERESKMMQKELTRSFQEFEKQMSELQLQAAQLEKQGRDAANIVMTIRQANLEF
ncbi:MAG: hypothetical protein K2X27_02460 [Candidatus Obscuribacterales bacterium]|nr:hypothetical protein [Candidatus Obscuribacterales bacterium]